MAKPIEKITISGFRGILHPMELDFTKGDNIKSIVLYGRNGTGKSSITDACEWFHTENVSHLRREGAGARSFPHRDAAPEQTYVEIEFSDLDTARLEYNADRITSPTATGDIQAFRDIASHPFYIRFDDLKEFVYQTKTEKYERLAELMGFNPQVEFQKSLQRVLNKLSSRLETRKNTYEQRREELFTLLNISTAKVRAILAALEERFERNNFDAPESLEDIEVGRNCLEKRIENDPKAQRIGELEKIEEALGKASSLCQHIKPLREYIEQIRDFADVEASAIESLLLELYEKGAEVLEAQSQGPSEVTKCPLCEESYKGDLLDHVKVKLDSLRNLKSARNKLKQVGRSARKSAQKIDQILRKVPQVQSVAFSVDNLTFESLQEEADDTQKKVQKVRSSLDSVPDSQMNEYADALSTHVDKIADSLNHFDRCRDKLLKAVLQKKEILKEGSERAQLVSDYNHLRDAIEKWNALQRSQADYSQLQTTYTYFEQTVEDYIQVNIEDVRKRFTEISADVRTYFELLEEGTDGISDPEIKLVPDKDRAIMLEVGFHGTATSPAYKYLSESQLNSFGIAIFLASAKRFNSDFPFIVLDDVVNSLDGYKRPQLITLLKQELSDHQFLLMTHDNFWRDRLFEQFQDWNRVQIIDWKPRYGPVLENGKTAMEEVDDAIRRDKPVMAGQMLGPYVERRLRTLCEWTGASMPYQKNPSHGLDRLLNALISRAKNTVGKSSEMYEALRNFYSQSAFRNLCAHGRTPTIQITSGEMKSAYVAWKKIENLFKCTNNKCNGHIRYDGSKNVFYCSCANTKIE